MTLILRPAGSDDAAATSGLLARLGYRACERALSERLARAASAPDAQVIAAIDGDELVGLVALELTPRPAGRFCRCRLAVLVVSEERRGEGIGRILLAAAEAVASAHGCGKLEASSAQPSGRRFLRRAGFEERAGRLVKPLAGAAPRGT